MTLAGAGPGFDTPAPGGFKRRTPRCDAHSGTQRRDAKLRAGAAVPPPAAPASRPGYVFMFVFGAFTSIHRIRLEAQKSIILIFNFSIN